MESVWDYPRPPRCEPTSRRIQVRLDELVVADTRRAYRVLETSHPPVYYLPPDDIRMDLLEATSRETHCEFKGRARYWTLRINDIVVPHVAWSYLDPTPGFAAIRGYLAFYLEPLEGFVDGEKSPTTTGPVLWRLDYPGHSGAFQGRARHPGLVVRRVSVSVRHFARGRRRERWCKGFYTIFRAVRQITEGRA